jgi:hypothetical protein
MLGLATVPRSGEARVAEQTLSLVGEIVNFKQITQICETDRIRALILIFHRQFILACQPLFVSTAKMTAVIEGQTLKSESLA